MTNAVVSSKAPQAPIPDQGIQSALQILKTKANLCRYKETSCSLTEPSEASLLERDFASFLGKKYAAAFNSCGSSLFVALKCAGVQPGDSVLMNCFTLAPVPGAIAHAGAKPILVHCGDDCRVDMKDLESKMKILQADTNQKIKVFLLSHMRGLMPNLDEISNLCHRYGILLIEDCAHTLGKEALSKQSHSSTIAWCFSFQSNKHINAGEGGMLVTDDPDMAAQAILYSGSYMFYDQHIARPPEDVFEKYKYTTPNFSMRMSELTAALARSQLPLLPQRTNEWNQSYQRLERALRLVQSIQVVERNLEPVSCQQGESVGSSIQFRVVNLPQSRMEEWIQSCSSCGVHIQWFGRSSPRGFTSNYQSWHFAPSDEENTCKDNFLERLCDMRVPLELTQQEAHHMAEVMQQELQRIAGSPLGAIKKSEAGEQSTERVSFSSGLITVPWYRRESVSATVGLVVSIAYLWLGSLMMVDGVPLIEEQWNTTNFL